MRTKKIDYKAHITLNTPGTFGPGQSNPTCYDPPNSLSEFIPEDTIQYIVKRGDDYASCDFVGGFLLFTNSGTLAGQEDSNPFNEHNTNLISWTNSLTSPQFRLKNDAPLDSWTYSAIFLLKDKGVYKLHAFEVDPTMKIVTPS